MDGNNTKNIQLEFQGGATSTKSNVIDTNVLQQSWSNPIGQQSFANKEHM